MVRSRAAAGVVATILFGGVSGVASAQVTPLSGERLNISEGLSQPPYPFFLACAGALSGSHFRFVGLATGPYPGLFVETGTARYAPKCEAPPPLTTPLVSYSASFTLFTAGASVTGTETKTRPATVHILGSAGGSGVTIGPVSTRYTATITTAHTICTDRGTSTATVSQWLGEGIYWHATLHDGPLVSTGSLVCRPRS